MKKPFSNVLAVLLALILGLSQLSIVSFGTEEGEQARLIEGLPSDGTYGVICACGKTPCAVVGADISDGVASARTVKRSADGKIIPSLPVGAAVFRFLKNDDGTYYLKLGGAYLAITLIHDRSRIVLQDTASGAKWDLVPDGSGAYTVASHDVPSSDRYLECCNDGIFACKMTADQSLFQFQFYETSPDGDGCVGAPTPAGSEPVNGARVVIYNHGAGAVFGQPTGTDTAAAGLKPAAAILGENGGLAYEDVADGGLIFNVQTEGTGSDARYLFETCGRYLAMTARPAEESGNPANAGNLELIPMPADAERRGCVQWTLEQTDGGYLLYNAAVRSGENPCCAAFCGDVFGSGTRMTADPADVVMCFFPMQDKDGQGYVVNPKALIEPPEPAMGVDCPVRFVLDDMAGTVSVEATYTCSGGGADTVRTISGIPMTGKRGSFTIPAAELEGREALHVRIAVQNALGKAYEAAGVWEIRDEPLICGLFPAADSATGEVTRPEIAVTYANVREGAVFEMLVDGKAVPAEAREGKYAYLPAEDMTRGRHTVRVTITRADGKQAVACWQFYLGEGGERLYFGQIHAHTGEYSDGTGTLEEAFEHAHSVDDLDFLIVTDHSNFFDSPAAASASSYYDLHALLQNSAKTASRWEEARATAREYNERYDDFLCAYGYEMTWAGGPGHINTYNTYGVVSRNNRELNDKSTGMYRYNDLIANAERGLDVEGNEAQTIRDGQTVSGVSATKYIPFDDAGRPVPVVSQFNHPGKTFGDFDSFAGYTARRDDVLNLIEVGNGAGRVGGSGYYPSYEAYDRCLSMGWHVGPTNNQDNHHGEWGSANTCRDVILTGDFSEIGLYRALDQRRIYATEDQNLRIYYSLIANGETYQLGDIAPIGERDRPAVVTVRLDITDPDPADIIAAIEVIGEGGEVRKRVAVNGTSFSGELEIPNTDGYYYIRVTERDGQLAVTAPIWVREAVSVATELKTSATVAVQGEPETVTATLRNGSEQELLLVRGCRVEADGRILLDETGMERVVSPDREMEVQIPYTPAVAVPAGQKTSALTVTFFATFRGREMTFTKTVTETAYPAEGMTWIGLDRGHGNLYVSGGCEDSERAFLRICAERGILCRYLEAGQMTAENLANYKAVVLTVPYINENTRPPVWSTEELQAVADYAAHGGSILNLSKSDRYDYTEPGTGAEPDAYASAALSNRINEAVGAQTRFVRGIVVDDAHRINEAYRMNLYSENRIGDHMFTAGIFETSNGTYQWYDGTGIQADPCLRFSDVRRNSYYHNAVDFVLEHGLMSGISQTVFGPKTPLTREMLVTILWQAAGRPPAACLNPFTDVNQSHYSYQPILWAYENGITSGRTPTTFARKAAVTRQELVTFLYRFAEYKHMDLSAAADLSGYPDAGTVSGYARRAMEWAVANGVISGAASGGVTYLSPRTSSDRAQVAVVLQKFMELTGEELPKAESAVAALIAPYPTAWIASYRADFTGPAYVPDYERDTVMAEPGTFSLVTAEKLPGGGFLVCGGACFLSDFDLRWGVPAAGQYANYALVCNILDAMKQSE